MSTFGRFGVKDNIINKRRHIRAPLNVKVILYPSIDEQAQPMVKFIKDISASGAFIESVAVYSVGTILKLMFPITNADKTVQTKAKVVRVVEPMSANDYLTPGMGVEFLEVPFDSSVLLDNYVINIKYVYEELILLTTMNEPDLDRIMHLVKKANIGEYRDYFELKEKVKKIAFSLGILSS